MTTTLQTSPNCSTGCKTRDHATYGECLRAKSTRVAWANSAASLDRSFSKAWDNRISEYRAAKKEGIQPDGSSIQQIRDARRKSDELGRPYRGDGKEVG